MMLRENSIVLVTTHNAMGKVIYTGGAKVEKVNKHKHGIEYICRCDDGLSRSVAKGDKRYPKDTIMEM